MAEFPVLPIFTDAYLGDTSHLTTTEHGAYWLLIITEWRSPGCKLPDDDRLLARYARLTASQWRRMRPVLALFFKVQGGFWVQPRLMDEYNAVRRKREQRASAGHASALKRKDRHLTNVEAPLDDRATNPEHLALDDKSTNTREHDPPPRPKPTPNGDDGGKNELYGLLQELCLAGGVKRGNPVAIVRDLAVLEAWIADGINIETEVRPTIAAEIAKATAPINSLKYYDPPVRRAHAKLLAGGALAGGASPRKPNGARPSPRRDSEQIRYFEQQAERMRQFGRAEDAAEWLAKADRLRGVGA